MRQFERFITDGKPKYSRAVELLKALDGDDLYNEVQWAGHGATLAYPEPEYAEARYIFALAGVAILNGRLKTVRSVAKIRSTQDETSNEAPV